MTVITGTPEVFTIGVGSIDVPAGVNADMVGLICLSTADGTEVAAVPARLGATIELIEERAATNMRVATYRVTGVAEGDTIDVTGNAKQCYWNQFYTDEFDIDIASVESGVRPGSQATTTTGAVIPASGQRVLVVACERTTADGTTVSSVVSSGGETVTQISFQEDAATTDSSQYFGTFTASAAASRTVTVTHASGSGNGYAALILLTDIVAAGATVHYVATGGVLTAGAAFYIDDAEEMNGPYEVRELRAGYPSITAMLAEDTFYMAHRGGSEDWPEMSLHAYTQAAYWGVGCLEISLARTSDGVFFGLHDADLDRTSGTDGFIASEHTWAEVQEHEIAPLNGAPAQPDQPYMRLEELIEIYGSTHVLFIDPKVINGTGRTALLDYLDTIPDSTDRFVAKYVGVTASSWPTAARARGYQTWGYFYEEDLGNLATYESLWDILGMEHGASQGTWDAILAFNKPVIAHVISTSAQATSALGKGAHGLQVADVTEVIPRA